MMLVIRRWRLSRGRRKLLRSHGLVECLPRWRHKGASTLMRMLGWREEGTAQTLAGGLVIKDRDRLVPSTLMPLL